MNTFVINGPGGSGKNTFIKMVRLFLRPHSIPVYSITSVFPIKKFLLDSDQWDGITKDTRYRKLMAETKRQFVADGKHPNIYVLGQCALYPDAVHFIHIREADQIHDFLYRYQERFSTAAQTVHYERQDSSMQSFKSGVDLAIETRAFADYDFDIVNETYGINHMQQVVKGFLAEAFPGYHFGTFDSADLEKDDIHREFDDEMHAGFA